jgi:glutaminyl-tRNA synthetase
MDDAKARAGGQAQTNFIEDIIDEDNRTGRWGGRVHTRFPPEPNGYLHIGHGKSICLNYGLAVKYGGQFNLRFDDTNPEKEEQEYVDSIIADVRWLGAERGDRLFYGSDYFQAMHDFAVELIKKGKAYVCDLNAEQMRAHRGTLTSPGRNSPNRERRVEENLDLFERMRTGEFPDGSRTLRAKIDMASPNLNLRDPVMYRIVHAHHHRQGDAWAIYPMYDWAHGLEDSLEGITHSICTLEFENHRPLYDWFIDAINEGRGPGGPGGPTIHHPQQIEFARGELTHTVMSKRKLLELVKGGYVRGWDDPRMPTLSGLRRRGYTPESIRQFWADVGVAKFNSTIEVGRLEHAVRDDLNKRAPRRMAVMKPLKLVIENYPEGEVEELEAINNPEDPSAGTRRIPFSRVLYLEQDDFREAPPKGYFRLSPGREVRLRYAYFITCTGVVKDPATGELTELRCTYDPATRGGDAPDGRKVKATLHWVSAAHAIPAEVRLYDHLFSSPLPEDVPEGVDYKTNLNPNSLEVVKPAWLEPSLVSARVNVDAHGTIDPNRFQFERLGYFCVDPDSRDSALVFNRTVTLKDSWARIEKSQGAPARA